MTTNTFGIDQEKITRIAADQQARKQRESKRTTCNGCGTVYTLGTRHACAQLGAPWQRYK